MKRVPSLFVLAGSQQPLASRQVTPGCEWVLEGKGVATRQYDGLCHAMIVNESKGQLVLYRRRIVQPGEKITGAFMEVERVDGPPPCVIGWDLVADHRSADRWAIEAWQREKDMQDAQFFPGTYELCGPRVNGNPEQWTSHMFVRHGAVPLVDVPAKPTFEALREYFASHRAIEGIVWHGPNGAMAKCKGRYFGALRLAPGRLVL